ncbi:glycosyltransferase family 4 protein [Pseudomonas sp. AOB-7]|uniref:glycosyltransferase family 4 protein n=1 Tax=Pseudomonas sp. AOB-7 TaxID=2482750 RepID=UPI000EFD92DF|nr:glycosyltransferase [Pseudomonas sp. AOB-7]RMH85295.1 glycosyltransferase family 4 protein [Pseudomonas sp. AOB-7]
MRILILANVPPGAVGGAEVQALHLARRWAASGHQVTVAGHANQPLVEENLSIRRIPTIRLGRPLRAASYLVSTLGLLWTHRNDVDVIYCRFLKEQAIAASLGKLLFGLKHPLIACPACASIGGEAELIKASRFRKLLTSLFAREINTINTMSSAIRSEMLDLGFTPEKLSNIPNGVVIPPLPDRTCPASSTLKIIFVGRLTHQKGLDTLIKAAHLVRKRNCAFQLNLVGDGPLRQELRSLIEKLDLVNHVFLDGPVSPMEVSDKLLGADLFILPSRFEGMPGALLEAIAHGLPAIATEVSGSEEIVDASIGWTVPVDDSSALADALQNAIGLGSIKLRAMGGKSRKKALAQFSADIVAERYEKLFIQLLQRKSIDS